MYQILYNFPWDYVIVNINEFNINKLYKKPYCRLCRDNVSDEFIWGQIVCQIYIFYIRKISLRFRSLFTLSSARARPTWSWNEMYVMVFLGSTRPCVFYLSLFLHGFLPRVRTTFQLLVSILFLHSWYCVCELFHNTHISFLLSCSFLHNLIAVWKWVQTAAGNVAISVALCMANLAFWLW